MTWGERALKVMYIVMASACTAATVYAALSRWWFDAVYAGLLATAMWLYATKEEE